MLNFGYKMFCIMMFFIFFMSCRAPFQPTPYVYEKWERRNASVTEKKEFIKKCGYPSFLGEGGNTDDNEVALMHLCMEKYGFKYLGEYGTHCHQYPTLPACVEAAAAKKAAD